MAPLAHHLRSLFVREQKNVHCGNYAGIGSGGCYRFNSYDTNKPVRQHHDLNGKLAGAIVPSIAAVLFLCYLVHYQPWKRRDRYDGEVRNQDRMNKSLRWKTLKKDVADEMKSRGGKSCEKDADVEALAGVKIRPMEEWTISPTTSIESLAKAEPQRPTRWHKFIALFGALAPKATKEEALIIIEKPELQEPAAVRR